MNSKFEGLPLVSVGMPIRNGCPYLASAMNDILVQDYPNIEIIVSDNCSDDDTPELLSILSAKDSRIRIKRQPRLLTAFDNFGWVLGQASGKYFLWAAHDDLRPANYISSLVRHLEDNSEAVLAFGAVRVSPVFGGEYVRKQFRFENIGLNPYARMRKAAHQQCYHIYGVWPVSALKTIPFIFNPWWPDLPLMIAAAALGEFHQVPGIDFDYLEISKTNLQRAQYQDNSRGICRICRAFKLFVATFSTVRRNSGVAAALFATGFVVEKQFRVAWDLLTGRIQRGQR